MHTDTQLNEIQSRAGRICRCDDAECRADLIQLADNDVPALVSEVRQLRGYLRTLAAVPDGQEVVSVKDLRVSGDGGHVVSGPSFIAVHEEDLAARIERMLDGADPSTGKQD